MKPEIAQKFMSPVMRQKQNKTKTCFELKTPFGKIEVQIIQILDYFSPYFVT